LLYWIYKRARHEPEPAAAPAEADSAEVRPVGDAASTVA
jgi:hypothetical protein